MRIVHASDWHGGTALLPKADIYVLTGDMLPNFPILHVRTWEPKLLQNRIIMWDPNGPSVDPTIPWGGKPKGDIVGRTIDRDREKRLQDLWIKSVLGSYRQIFATTDAPVIVVRGNHDFTDLAQAVGGDVWEVSEDPTRTIDIGGLKFGGFRGIPWIAGEWSDEKRPTKLPGDVDRSDVKSDEDLETILEQVPNDIDVLVSHCPPEGVLDTYGHSLGSQAVSTYVNRRNYLGTQPRPLRAHLFGHIHECGGRTLQLGETLFSNAATKFNVIDIEV
jgi:Icc-related predicted phosphoesterase